ncbi:hypothetical protein D5F01_LYC15452 [Larimichthys crocea]|uniref:PiggyBac transposable element-derived protein domain-containing protein n=1 Tax=Larimichthys crocea TaxID=215358 RepID=A0A6G0I2X4_LARCR|nr:hypothetical protein D5F01_LYC15452 [Larimichthys crocea]
MMGRRRKEEERNREREEGRGGGGGGKDKAKVARRTTRGRREQENTRRSAAINNLSVARCFTAKNALEESLSGEPCSEEEDVSEEEYTPSEQENVTSSSEEEEGGGEGEEGEEEEGEGKEGEEEEEEEGGDEEENLLVAPETFLSRNGKITWSSTPYQTIPLQQQQPWPPGPTAYVASNVCDIISTFRLFLTPEIDKIMLEEHYHEGLRKYGRDSWKQMDEIDLHAYVGLFILASVYRSRGEATASPR